MDWKLWCARMFKRQCVNLRKTGTVEHKSRLTKLKSKYLNSDSVIRIDRWQWIFKIRIWSYLINLKIVPSPSFPEIILEIAVLKLKTGANVPHKFSIAINILTTKRKSLCLGDPNSMWFHETDDISIFRQFGDFEYNPLNINQPARRREME